MQDENPETPITEEEQLKQKEQQLKQYKGRVPRVLAEEVKELRSTVKKKRNGQLVKVDRLDLFMDEYFKNGGNATNAAMVVFDCKSRAVAARVGSAYLTKAKDLGRLILEDEGATYAKLIRMALTQMEKPKADGTFVALWDRLMKLGGYEDFIAKQQNQVPAQINVTNIHSDLVKKYTEGEVIDAEEGDDEDQL